MDSAPQTPQPQAVSEVAPGAPPKRVSEEVVGLVSVAQTLFFTDNDEEIVFVPVDEQGQPSSGEGLDSE